MIYISFSSSIDIKIIKYWFLRVLNLTPDNIILIKMYKEETITCLVECIIIFEKCIEFKKKKKF